MPLPPSADAGDWVHDFVHSDNSRFKGKSKQSRIRMALGAYYAKKRSHSESMNEDDSTPNVDRTDKAAKLGTYTLPNLHLATNIDPASPPGTTSVVNKGTTPNSLGSSLMASKESGKKKLKEGSDGGFSGAEPLIGEDGKKVKKKKNIKEQNFNSKTNLPDFSGIRKFREANPSGLLTMDKINNMLSSPSSGTSPTQPTSPPTPSSAPSSSAPTSQESGKKKKLKEEILLELLKSTLGSYKFNAKQDLANTKKQIGNLGTKKRVAQSEVLKGSGAPSRFSKMKYIFSPSAHKKDVEKAESDYSSKTKKLKSITSKQMDTIDHVKKRERGIEAASNRMNAMGKTSSYTSNAKTQKPFERTYASATGGSGGKGSPSEVRGIDRPGEPLTVKKARPSIVKAAQERFQTRNQEPSNVDEEYYYHYYVREESPEDPMTVAGTKGAPNPNASRMQVTNLESGKKKTLRKSIIPDKYTNYGGRDTGMSI
jgi:hypothetical protein